MRNTNTVTWAQLARPHQVFFFFLKMVWPSPVGTLRWTNYSNRVDTIALNLEGTSQTWDCSQGFEIGDLEQSDQGLFTISDLAFPNASNVMGQRVRKHGWRDRAITVYVAYFDEDPPFAFRDSFVLYDGSGDRSESGDMVRCSLRPGKAIYSMKFPRRRFDVASGFKFLPPPKLQIPWGSGTLTAPGAGVDMSSGPGGPAPGWWLPPDVSGNPDRTVTPRPTTPPPAPRVVAPR